LSGTAIAFLAFPAQSGHVRSAQSGCQREGCHVAQMGRQLAQQRARLVPVQESDASCRLFEESYRRHTIEPFPVASTFAQDRPNQSERAVHSPVAAPVRPFCFGDRIDQCPIDTLEFPIGQIAIEPTQLLLVVLERSLVELLSEPTNRRVQPESPWPVPKLL
jgi:hypothetical protein